MFMPKERSKGDSMPGKAARGLLDSKGNFKLSTYGRYDGAIIGTHIVTYLAGETNSEDEDSDEQEEGKERVAKGSSKPSSDLGFNEGFEIEVKPKSNVFEIEIGNRNP